MRLGAVRDLKISDAAMSVEMLTETLDGLENGERLPELLALIPLTSAVS